jgi:hypothetical protein
MTGFGMSLSIPAGGIAQFVFDRVLEHFGKDPSTESARKHLEKLIRIASKESASIQCVGMYKPIGIDKIYQTTRLDLDGKEISVFKLLQDHNDVVVLGRPGQGKTTLLRWLFTRLARNAEWVPILFTLNRSSATQDLLDFIAQLGAGAAQKALQRPRIALLVDGYDEVSPINRKRISEALMDFQGHELGNFFLSCRSFYEVHNIQALRCEIADFNRSDAVGYIESFSRAYGSEIDPSKLLVELDRHRLSSFASHPLLLALICLLKSGPMSQLPRDVIGLLRRTLDTLTFKWDREKGLNRHSVCQLDGVERERCLMRIAFQMKGQVATDAEVRRIASEHLKLIHRATLDVRKLLVEIAQFYGLLVPTSDGRSWQFAHLTILDYLAARYWVETGQFDPSRIKHWNSRAAIAACLLPNGTEAIKCSLTNSEDLFAFSECLLNNAPFDPVPVAGALVDHFEKYKNSWIGVRDVGILRIEIEQDFFSLLGNDLLVVLLAVCTTAHSNGREILAAYALSELRNRKLNVPEQLVEQVRLYYDGTRDFDFEVKRRTGWEKFLLSELIPKRKVRAQGV